MVTVNDLFYRFYETADLYSYQWANQAPITWGRAAVPAFEPAEAGARAKYEACMSGEQGEQWQTSVSRQPLILKVYSRLASTCFSRSKISSQFKLKLTSVVSRFPEDSCFHRHLSGTGIVRD